MFALAKLYFVCPLGAVVKTDHGTASAKFKDGAYYDVDIVTTHESFDVLEELKYSLCSHSPRIVLSRCDVNSSIKSEQKGLEIDTFPTILKEEIVEEEFCIKEELISHSPNFDTFLENDLVEEEEACRGNFFEDCPSLNILTQQEVVVNDISFQNAYEGVFHDHSYSVKNGESDDEIPSRISLPNEFEILDEQQKSVKDGRDASDRFPVYILHNDSQVDMDCHSNLSNSSVPDKFNIGDVIPDLNNITQEEIVVNSDFFESTVEAIPPYCERGADLHYCLLEPQEGPIIDVECSNERTSATGTGEGNQDVQNGKLSYARRKKQYFCVYCKKLYTALPRHLERRHRDEECVKQFCDLPKGSEQRRAILKELLHRSNLIYNTNGNYNQGHLLVVRRPPKGQPYSATDYASCPVCRAFYSKRSVRKHIKRCRATARESANDFLDEQLPACICSVLQEDILPLLTDTKLVKVIQSDRLIVAYGNHLCEQYKNPERHGFIMESLEYIGRLFCAIKNAKPFVKDLASIFVPSHVKTVENAIETVAEVDDDEPWESGYNDVDDLRRVCVEAAEVWKAECLKSNDETRLKQTNYFLRLFNKYKEFMPEGVLDARRKWSTSTKARFFQMFKAHLESKRLPSNTQCRMAMKKLPSLQSKTVAAVKTAIFNEIRRRERDCQRKIRMNTSVSTSTHNV